MLLIQINLDDKATADESALARFTRNAPYTWPGDLTPGGNPGGNLSQKISWVVDIWRNALYNKIVIKTFKDEPTQKIYQRQPSRKLPPDIQQVALRKLRMINNATSLTDLRVPPANRLEKLSGDRTGQWSIRVNDQYPESGMLWRICFEWRESDAYDVEIVDYH